MPLIITAQFVVTSINNTNNTFTYTDPNPGLPTNPSGGTPVAYPATGITNLYVMQPSTQGGNTPLPAGTLFTPAALSMAAQYTTLRFMDLIDTNGSLTSLIGPIGPSSPTISGPLMRSTLAPASIRVGSPTCHQVLECRGRSWWPWPTKQEKIYI